MPSESSPGCQQGGYKSCVVKTPDTEKLMMLLYHASMINLSIYLDYSSGKHHITELLSSSTYYNTLLKLFVFTGEDCTNAFKVNSLKKLQQHPKFHSAL